MEDYIRREEAPLDSLCFSIYMGGFAERMCLIGSQEAYMFHGSMFWFPLFAGEYLLQIEILFFF